ncbi:MAG: aldo/keto reductase [Desulfovibrionaceae bacterium]|nr:aldo/keto reductase [Desulfovibrionaceae bacterium]
MSEKNLSRRQILAGLAAACGGMAGLGTWANYERAKENSSPQAGPGISREGKTPPPKDKMTYTTTSRSGDKVSILGFGCMRYPVMPGESSPRSQNINEAAAFELVDYAIDHGVNYFDTAWGYHGGASQIVTGKALHRHPRDKFFLATKMPGYLNPTLARAKEMFETQLTNCQVEYFDYYLLHNLSLVANFQRTYEQEGVLNYLLEERKRGRIRNLGFSFHGDKEMLEYALTRDVPWDFVMVQLNYHDLLHQLIPNPFIKKNVPTPAPTKWMLEKILDSKLPFVIMEPLLGGRLARLNGQAKQILQAERPDDTPASWAFRYVAGLPNVLTILSGMTYHEHLEDNLATFSPYVPLSAHEHQVLEKALQSFVQADNIRCTTCGYCMPCPYGVDIPAVFKHHNDCLDDNLVPKDPSQVSYHELRTKYLNSQMRRIPELQTASHCTGCGQCLSKCPQFINIPEEMLKLHNYTKSLRTV